MEDKFTRYLSAVSRYVADHPQLRYGQAAFNALGEQHSDIADQVLGSGVDPFHDDHVVPEFLALVRTLLSLHPSTPEEMVHE